MSQHSCVCSFFGSFSDNCSWAERTMIVERRPQLDVPLMPTAASYIREMDVPVLLPASPPLFPPNVWPVLISVHRRAQNWWRWNNGCSVLVNPTRCVKVKKKMKENENPTATKERYLLAAQSGFLQAWFSVATGWMWPNKRETERKFLPSCCW